jgi:hypothetical protein
MTLRGGGPESRGKAALSEIVGGCRHCAEIAGCRQLLYMVEGRGGIYTASMQFRTTSAGNESMGRIVAGTRKRGSNVRLVKK